MKRSLPILAVSILAISFSAVSTTSTFRAEVTVQNAVKLDKDDDLSFGTIRAVADLSGTHVASIVVNPLPAASPVSTSSSTGTDASISIIDDGVPASFTVSEAVKNAQLKIISPTQTTLEYEGTKDDGRPNFTIGNWTYVITSGPNENETYTDGTPNLMVDSTDGTVSFNIGATLSTPDSAAFSKDYADGVYSGDFQIEVAY
ncbi:MULTISPECIES: DUF4402 domain-containing protein [unclassified Pseudoalteromonas]|jgi:hypothetical protein|uniref:DUF4402 domain-containing protein n=1 Tax=unclassified Pseudoalteromonas TaxID=194690 RepID=UPI0016026A4D|nr:MULTISPECIES: DUF4402 domain-containing protein [unclassified Pseudoalteromonas]MBB1308792.1 DUF4402 domain-containing protein [Pseudoalteromonas sp. SR41-8]MBB1398430.1 DUF4402 domain-containing protein [Pseudoalteromonas sp. SG44-8]MBB1408093.1 DUF4402 domain-containing protein [Pseudoalteromonas sp. SG44-17]